jgi:hypothetical protein
MKNNALTILGFSMIILLQTSCSTSKVLPTDVSDKAKSIEIPESKAVVYLFRISSLGAAVGLRIDCNNIELATLYEGNPD